MSVEIKSLDGTQSGGRKMDPENLRIIRQSKGVNYSFVTFCVKTRLQKV